MINTEFGFRDKVRALDYLLLFSALSLSSIGFLCLYEVGGQRSLLVQIVATGIGLTAALLLSFIDYERYCGKRAWILFGVSVALLALTLFIGTGEGNRSWIDLGFTTLQPSEFVKVLFLITLASHINAVKDNINDIKNVLPLLLHGGIIIGLVLLEGDLGSALVFLFVYAVMLYVGGLSLWYFLGGLAAVVAASPFLWKMLGDYQQKRILVGFHPELDPLDKGWQQIQSKKAIAAGGLNGVGMGNTKLAPSVPKVQNDMIFSAIGELFGFFGILVFLALMTLLICRLLRLSRKARKDTGSYLCAGAAAIFVAQTVENVGMCLGKMPVIGITLPLVSSGGSSVLSLYLALGAALSVGTHRRKYYFEREET